MAAPAAIDAELDRDRTASGERAAAEARALVPTPEAKEEAWRRVTSDEKIPNWLQRALLQGFANPRHIELTAPYVARFFEVVDEIWATRDSEPAQEFVYFGYPEYQVNPSTIEATDVWLAAAGHPTPLRRLVAEGRDSVVRAMTARAMDTSHDHRNC
jgi:aminopeptidase N